MKEVDLQSKGKEAIVSMGGMAMKMSNRFLVGVPDMLFKLPDYDASFWEFKYAPRLALMPKVTMLQKKWLRDYSKAGGLSGVVFFNVYLSDLHVGIRSTSSFGEIQERWTFNRSDFVVIPRGSKMQPFKDRILELHEQHKRTLAIRRSSSDIR